MITARVRDRDLVLLAIGDDLREELIGEIITTSEQQPPMILVRTLHAGDVFRVALVRPGIDASPRLRKCDESTIAGRLAKAEQFLQGAEIIRERRISR
jgi:hypothetical protein